MGMVTMSEYDMNATLCYEGGVETVEITAGGKIIFPEMAIQMTAGNNTIDVTDNTPIGDGMRGIRKHIQRNSQ